MNKKTTSFWKKFLDKYLFVLVVLVIFVVLWYIMTIPLKGFLPPPDKVIQDLLVNIFTATSYTDIWLTMRRILIGFVGALFIGISLGVLMGNKKTGEAFLLPWVIVLLAIPGPVGIIMAILILGIQESSTLIAAVVLTTPFITNIVYQGVRSMDPKLNQMSKLYQFSKRRHLTEVILPQITPSILAAIRTGFSITWKEVVIIEAISQPRGIGAQILSYYKMLQPSQVLAWTFMFTIIMFMIEFGIFRRVENRLLRWKKTAQA